MHDGDPHIAPVIAHADARLTGQPPRDAPVITLTCKRLTSDALLAGKNEIEIEHGASIYRLRITSLGKLILTK